MDTGKEKEFANSLNTLVRKAREQKNMLSEEQVKDAFKDLDLGDEQLGLVYDYLSKHNVGIGEPADSEDYLTLEETDFLKEYIQSLDELEEISDSEKEGIVISAMSGDKSSQNRLIEVYLRNVPDIAKMYAEQGIFLKDLIGEGNVALTKAVTMLAAIEEPGEADEFISKLIMDAMEEAIADSLDEDARSQKVLKKVQDVADKAAELAEQMRRKVTIEELADETGLSKEKILEAVKLSHNAIEDIDYKEE